MTTGYLLLATLCLACASAEEIDKQQRVQDALDNLLLLEPHDLARVQDQAGRLVELRRALTSDNNKSDDCRATVLNETGRNTTVVQNNAASSIEADYLQMLIGIFFGPLILIYGMDLKAFLVLLNAMFAADFFGFIRDLQGVGCFAELEQSFPQRGFKVLFAVSTIATVGLKGGTVELILNVGIVSSKLNMVAYDLLEQATLSKEAGKLQEMAHARLGLLDH